MFKTAEPLKMSICRQHK